MIVQWGWGTGPIKAFRSGALSGHPGRMKGVRTCGARRLCPSLATMILRVTRRMSSRKARGLDHWGPEEIRVLPKELLVALARVLNGAERQGPWPEDPRQVLVALNPKDKAVHEGQLRPIGLLPMIYRIWMACRRRDATAWRRNVQGGETLGATEKTWVTRVTDELAEAAGDQAILDCSKCYERVPHRLAARRALDLGVPPRLAQMLFDMYRAPRRVRVHGAVSEAAVGHCGLPAGCAYAKDVLEGFLRPMAGHCTQCVFRGHVDDATLQAVHATARGAAACLGHDLCQVKQALRDDNMVLNDAKEQILGPTAAVRQAWADLWPDYQGNVVRQAKDLGACQRRLGVRNPIAD